MKTFNKTQKSRIRKVAQFTDKALDFLHRASGESYNLPEYQTMLQNAVQLVAQVHGLASQDAKTKPPPADESGEVQTDIEDITGRGK